MNLSVVWGIHGVAGGVLVLLIGLFLALAAVAAIDDTPHPAGSGRWLRQWRVAAWGTASLCVLVFGVAGLWGAFRIRTVELTVAHLTYSVSGKGATNYFVDDTNGNGYDTTGRVYDSLFEGDHVRCRVTDPLLFLEGTLISCARVKASKDRGS